MITFRRGSLRVHPRSLVADRRAGSDRHGDGAARILDLALDGTRYGLLLSSRKGAATNEQASYYFACADSVSRPLHADRAWALLVCKLWWVQVAHGQEWTPRFAVARKQRCAFRRCAVRSGSQRSNSGAKSGQLRSGFLSAGNGQRLSRTLWSASHDRVSQRRSTACRKT